ncbi:MAG: hypothetical protein EON58_06995 [Alphaproteobacteria bacterium]|nr:MAG: hypothetical protein EON58_06995 [Alphaproteobacteria bacterium]
MKFIVAIFCIAIIFSSCGKDKFTTEPQVRLKQVTNTRVAFTDGPEVQPRIIFEVTDGDGDLGLTDTSAARIYVKNLLTNKEDSFNFPTLDRVAQKDFKAEVEVGLYSLLGGTSLVRPRTDTLVFELYVRDLARHKSNVIVTSSDPVYFFTP